MQGRREQPTLPWMGSGIQCCNRGLSFDCAPMRLQGLLFFSALEHLSGTGDPITENGAWSRRVRP